MRSDEFGGNRVIFVALGCVWTLPEIFGFSFFFLDDFVNFWMFSTFGELTIMANTFFVS